ncbi:MAG: heparinase II/III family protein [Acidimicrobiales bacterium]
MSDRLDRALLTLRTARHLRPTQVLHRGRLRSQRALASRWPAAARAVLRPPRSSTGRPPGWPAGFLPVDAREPGDLPDAADAAHGRFRFLDQAVDLGWPPDWAPPGVPRLWSYHLHYAEWAWSFAAHPDRPWAQAAFARLWRSWRVSTTFGRWDEWSPYVASLRAWALCATFGELAAGTPLEAAMIHDLRVHLGYLRRHLELDVGGNHLVKNLKALVGLGVFLGDDRTVAAAVRRMADQLPLQVLADGGHYERSPSYHCQVLGDLLDVGGLLAAAGRPPVEGLDDAVVSMRRWLAAMRLPDGDVPLLNDCTLVGTHRLDLLAPAPPPPPGDGLVALRDSGYVVARRGRLHLVADAGPPCPPELPAHAHADCLTFVLAVDGRRLVVDGGTSTYEAGARRDHERSTAAHNTVEVDGENQTEVWGAFRAGRRARASLERASGGGTRDVEIVGGHDGYRRLPGGVTHRRAWVVGTDRLDVTDRLDGGGRHRVVTRWHLAPGTDARVVDGGRVAIGGAELCFEGVGTVVVEPSEVATGFGRRWPAPVVVASVTAELPVVIRATFHLER